MESPASLCVLMGQPPGAATRAEIAQGLAPRAEHLEIADRLDAEMVSGADAETRLGGPLGGLLRKDRSLASALAATRRRSDFEAIYVTGEDIGLRLAPLLRLGGWRGRLVMVVHACTSRARKALLKALGPDSFHTLVCVCEAQRRILVEELGFPARQVMLTPVWVDHDFFRARAPRPAEACGYVFACGRENRDYAALFAAASALDRPFRVSASGYWHAGGGLGAAPANVSVFQNRISFPDLRQTYEQARFVVAPLHAVPYAAGATGVVEAMAMGKAVIATASPGIAEYVEDGVTGRVVPPGDAAALARAVEDLWAQPGLCDAMGRRNRAWVEANAGLDSYVRRAAGILAPAREGVPVRDIAAVS
jgi:glycosyltransferase involved in cell wall biosynthesis